MSALTSASVALLWRGGIEARRNATSDNNRWHLVFAALKEAGYLCGAGGVLRGSRERTATSAIAECGRCPRLGRPAFQRSEQISNLMSCCVRLPAVEPGSVPIPM